MMATMTNDESQIFLFVDAGISDVPFVHKTRGLVQKSLGC
jgi:hypothetical protein